MKLLEVQAVEKMNEAREVLSMDDARKTYDTIKSVIGRDAEYRNKRKAFSTYKWMNIQDSDVAKINSKLKQSNLAGIVGVTRSWRPGDQLKVVTITVPHDFRR